MEPKHLSGMRSLNARLGTGAFVFLAFAVALVVANANIFSGMHGDAGSMHLFGLRATYGYQLLYYAERLVDDAETQRARHDEVALRSAVSAMDARFDALLNGDPEGGVDEIDDPSIRAMVLQRAEEWRAIRKPALLRFLASRSREERKQLLDGLRPQLTADAVECMEEARREQASLQGNVERAQVVQYVFLAIATVILALAIVVTRGIARRARQLARTASRIAGGELDLSASVGGHDELAVLGESFNAMTGTLRRLIEAERAIAADNEKHLWIAASLAGLSEVMSGNPGVKDLAQRVVDYLCQTTGAEVGALYISEDDRLLRLMGTVSLAAGDDVPATWRPGQGLVGRAAADKRPIVVDGDFADTLRVRWGTCEAVPRTLFVLPLIHEDEVRGVVELGAVNGLGDRQRTMLERSAPNIGLAIRAAIVHARLQRLLEESQAQAEELTVQQEELRSVNEKLEEQTARLALQKDSLVAAETVLRQKATELERASRYKSEFLANMSHELRTPLNSSLILAKLLSDNRGGNLTADQVRYAATIYSAGNDLLALINDILDLSKIEAGKVAVSADDVDLDGLLDTLRQRFAPLAGEQGLTLTAVRDPECPAVLRTDQQRLQQILTNLLANAVKFTEAGSITLRVRRDGHRHVELAVEDTGIGIAAEQHEVIFNAFRQADGTTNRKFGGTGLGLSISRELARVLGGEIRVASAPGHGSVFTLRLPTGEPGRLVEAKRAGGTSEPESAVPAPGPAAESLVPNPPGSLASSPAASGAHESIAEADPERLLLLVEDDTAFVDVLRHLAREAGFQCVVASSADEGVQLARRLRPAAIILDIGLPDTSGLTVLERLKRDPEARHIPIHVVSLHDYRHLAGRLGAAGYLLKSSQHDELAAMFRAIDQRRTGGRKRVLVVEDEGVQRRAIAELLSTDDVEVVAAESADEALGELARTTFDCVVVDLMLPEVSGFEFLDRLEERLVTVPPVIVYTARHLAADEEQRLRRYSRSIIIKGARSPERLLEEVTLFLHQDEAALTPDKQQMLRSACDREAVFEGRHVLLVEDDVRNVFALTSMLESRGMIVEIARNGKEAVERLQKGSDVDLILMDLMMPEMDGLTAIRTIRQSRGPAASLPIIALTAKAMPDDRIECLSAGANDYVAKPVDGERLLSLLRVWTTS